MVFGAPLVRHKTASQKNPTLKCLAPKNHQVTNASLCSSRSSTLRKPTASCSEGQVQSLVASLTPCVVAEACQEACKRSKTCAWTNSVLLLFQRCFGWHCKNHMWQGVYLKTCFSNLPKAIVGYYSDLGRGHPKWWCRMGILPKP